MCLPCGYDPLNQDRCQDIGNPHAGCEDDRGSRGSITDIPRSRSTLCCGLNWGSPYEVQAHRLSVHA